MRCERADQEACSHALLAKAYCDLQSYAAPLQVETALPVFFFLAALLLARSLASTASRQVGSMPTYYLRAALRILETHKPCPHACMCFSDAAATRPCHAPKPSATAFRFDDTNFSRRLFRSTSATSPPRPPSEAPPVDRAASVFI